MTEDWRSEIPRWRLRKLALEAMSRAYTLYSGYSMGAAALVGDERLISGCNIESVGYGVTLCTECGLISELVHGGGGKLLTFACVSTGTETITPCDGYRRLLAEHADLAMILDMPGDLMPMAEALPFAFGPGDLNVAEWTTPFVNKES